MTSRPASRASIASTQRVRARAPRPARSRPGVTPRSAVAVVRGGASSRGPARGVLTSLQRPSTRRGRRRGRRSVQPHGHDHVVGRGLGGNVEAHLARALRGSAVVAIATWAAATPASPAPSRLTWSRVTESAYAPGRSSTWAGHGGLLLRVVRARRARALEQSGAGGCGRPPPGPPAAAPRGSRVRRRTPRTAAAPRRAARSRAGSRTAGWCAAAAADGLVDGGSGHPGRPVHRQPPQSTSSPTRRQAVTGADQRAPTVVGEVRRSRRAAAGRGAGVAGCGSRRRASLPITSGTAERCSTPPVEVRRTGPGPPPGRRVSRAVRARTAPGGALVDDPDTPAGDVEVHRVAAAVQRPATGPRGGAGDSGGAGRGGARCRDRRVT